jgi:hypothetical protein
MSITSVPTVDCDDSAELITPRRTRLDPPHLPDTQPAAAVPTDDAPLDDGVTLLVARAPLTEEPLLEVEEPTETMLAVVVGENPEIRREQLQLQVAQLAEHLRERLREVDRREAALHARTSELEADVRASRMWLNEREMEFQERENELRRQIEELQERAERRPFEPQISVFDPDARQAELDEREQLLRLQEDAFRERRFEMDRQAAALTHAQQLCQQQRERDGRDLAMQRSQLTEEFHQLVAQREEQIQAAEALLNEHAAQLDRDQTALAADRHAWDQQKRRQREAIDELRTTAEAELADERARLAARQEWIERQRAGLDQVRDEALRLHRQALETRLLAEQLWAQITGALTPAEATQAIAHLRVKLAEQYRVEEQQLVARQNELVQLGERIAEQHRELEQLKTGIREWAATRQAEIERQAQSLVERELALDAQQDESRRSQQQWHAQRRQYEHQIRELKTQVRLQPAAA